MNTIKTKMAMDTSFSFERRRIFEYGGENFWGMPTEKKENNNVPNKVQLNPWGIPINLIESASQNQNNAPVHAENASPKPPETPQTKAEKTKNEMEECMKCFSGTEGRMKGAGNLQKAVKETLQGEKSQKGDSPVLTPKEIPGVLGYIEGFFKKEDNSNASQPEKTVPEANPQEKDVPNPSSSSDSKTPEPSSEADNVADNLDPYLFGLSSDSIEWDKNGFVEIFQDAPLNTEYKHIMPNETGVIGLKKEENGGVSLIFRGGSGFSKTTPLPPNATDEEVISAIRNNSEYFLPNQKTEIPYSNSSRINFADNDPIQVAMPRGTKVTHLEFYPNLQGGGMSPKGKVWYQKNGLSQSTEIEGDPRDPHFQQDILSAIEKKLTPRREIDFNLITQAVDRLKSSGGESLSDTKSLMPLFSSFVKTDEARQMLKEKNIPHGSPLEIKNYMDKNNLSLPQFLHQFETSKIVDALKAHPDTQMTMDFYNLVLKERDKTVQRMLS